jgi:hypothetical protein
MSGGVVVSATAARRGTGKSLQPEVTNGRASSNLHQTDTLHTRASGGFTHAVLARFNHRRRRGRACGGA